MEKIGLVIDNREWPVGRRPDVGADSSRIDLRLSMTQYQPEGITAGTH